MKWAKGLFVLLLLLKMAVFAEETSFKKLTVEDIYLNLNLYKKLPRGLKWLPKGKQLSYLKIDPETGEQQLWIMDAKSRQARNVLTDKQMRWIGGNDTIQVSLMGYMWFPEEDGLLLREAGDLFYYNFDRDNVVRLTVSSQEEENVSISPHGRKVAFVRNNDIYVVDVATRQEKRLTFDGNDLVLNGKKDWVYQEELGSRGDFKGYWWSPDGRYIAYYQMDDRPVPEYPIVDFSLLHPAVTMERYPKAGDPNPIVKVGVVDVQTANTLWLDLGEETDVYFPRVYWVPGTNQIAVMRLDRHQQQLDFLFCDPQTGKSHLVLSEHDSCWINVDDFVYFFKKKNWFLWGSERSGYRHLYLYDFQGNLIKQLTEGEWTVTSLEGVDERKGYAYFVGTRDGLLERHLYRVGLDSRKIKRLTRAEGVHSVRVAPGGRYFIDYFSAPLTPTRVSLYCTDGKLLKILEKNEHPELAAYHLSAPEFLEIPGENGLIYHAMMIKPPHFDPTKKYPVLVYVYGGPHSQLVIKRFTNLWHQLMAQKGYIVFTLDNRGTANRGSAWERAIYRRLGQIELQDQLVGVKYLKSLPYVDASRIGIWGWSYGGYMTLYALTRSREFKAGAAVAPVTDWHYYDTIYTERYMALPAENEDGYYRGSPIHFADSLHGALLIAHGTGDDNVHFQNTEQFIDRLVEAGKMYRLVIYPGQGHSIRSTEDRIHLFRTITRFFLENL